VTWAALKGLMCILQLRVADGCVGCLETLQNCQLME